MFKVELFNVDNLVDMISTKELKESLISFKLFDDGN